ncbi:MAG: peptidase M15 [Synergistaceae bacterium]|jgi:hypothetical protein|nr:peptidase M15 [Synergistaceae bacterium]
MTPLNDYTISPHFKLSEFECRCCRRVMLSSRLVPMLEELRGVLGRPLVITSGYRCDRHNAAVGGSKRSLHLIGRAADILYRPAALSPREIELELMKVKQISTKIGLYEFLPNLHNNYIHFSCK